MKNSRLAVVKKLMETDTHVVGSSRDVRVICSSDSADRVGDIIVQTGIDLRQYRKNPVVLWGHDADCPIARANEIGIVNGKLTAVASFPPQGRDQDSDWTFNKIKSGLINAASVGFRPIESEPRDPRAPYAGYKFKRVELLEFSFVSIPANADCVVIGRDILHGALRPPSRGGTPYVNADDERARRARQREVTLIRAGIIL